MLHAAILAELLDSEIDVAVERLGGRVRAVRRSESTALCELNSGAVLRLDASRYDAEPYAVSIVDADGRTLPGDRWPANLNHGEHPVLGRPFICIRGTYEYHTHPSHLSDHWDLYRGRLGLVDLLDHILRKTGI